MNDLSTAHVQHNPAQQRFSLAIGSSEAVLEYRLFNPAGHTGKPAVVDFTSTWVPPEFRGKGLAEKLVREGLKWRGGSNWIFKQAVGMWQSFYEQQSSSDSF